jgi:EAL domain-containing protein (putative c-di-GMP-specific phosphodiesterase class I)
MDLAKMASRPPAESLPFEANFPEPAPVRIQVAQAAPPIPVAPTAQAPSPEPGIADIRRAELKVVAASRTQPKPVTAPVELVRAPQVAEIAVAKSIPMEPKRIELKPAMARPVPSMPPLAKPVDPRPVLVKQAPPKVLEAKARARPAETKVALVKPVEPKAFEEVVQRSIHLRRLARLKRAVSDLPDVHGLKLGDRASLEARFSSALDKVWIAFQPIVQLSARGVLGYEALVRSSEPSLPGPADLFDAAGRLGRVEELARKIRQLASTSFDAAPKTALLFVNVHAEELNDEELYSNAAALTARAGRTVLEITERSALEGVQGLSARLARLRKLGFQLAVDDLGAGYAGLASFSRIEPEWVKLDMSLIRGVDRLSTKRSLVKGIAEICSRDLGIRVICEGVELPGERDVLAADGLDFLQGFLFARPAAGFPAPVWGSMAPEIDRASANR